MEYKPVSLRDFAREVVILPAWYWFTVVLPAGLAVLQEFRAELPPSMGARFMISSVYNILPPHGWLIFTITLIAVILLSSSYKYVKRIDGEYRKKLVEANQNYKDLEQDYGLLQSQLSNTSDQTPTNVHIKIDNSRRVYLVGSNKMEGELESKSAFRSIDINEIHHGLTVAERVALADLSETEFHCEIKPYVGIPTTEGGWFNFDGAVVHGEDLIAIEIYEINDRLSVNYFGLEYIRDKVKGIKFERFQKFVLYVFVVSERTAEQDEIVRARLEEIKSTAPFEMKIIMQRLSPLRLKYGL